MKKSIENMVAKKNEKSIEKSWPFEKNIFFCRECISNIYLFQNTDKSNLA